MGQKVNPIGFRLGVYRNWDARWFSDREYAKLLHEDLAMRRLVSSRLRNAAVARIETERSANQLTVVIQTAKPGIVIGKQGSAVDALRDELEGISGKKVRVAIHEIKSPDQDAKLVAENVASQLEKRIAFRRAIKQAVMRTMRGGAKGVRVQVSGRLGGAEMCRREWDRDGRVPLHTLRAHIDYGQALARTTFGTIGVSAWIYKGDFVTATGEPIMGAAAVADEDAETVTEVTPGVVLAAEAPAEAIAQSEQVTADESVDVELPDIPEIPADVDVSAVADVPGVVADEVPPKPARAAPAKRKAAGTRKPAATKTKVKKDVASEDEEEGV